FTVSVASLVNGTYSWRIKGPKFLANTGLVSLSGATRTNVEAGTMTTGDCDNNNLVNMVDFNVLKLSMGRSPGDPAYDDRADLNGNQIVNVTDFTLLFASMGRGGSPPIDP